MKRFLRRALIAFACLAAAFALLILFYAEEDWRGARDWAQCQRDLAAKGESLDLRVLCPPGKPEDDLSTTPVFEPLYKNDPARAFVSQLDPHLGHGADKDAPHLSGYRNAKPLDLEAWQHFYHSLASADLDRESASPAGGVLEVLGKFNFQWDVTIEAVSRPEAYFPVDYDRPLTSRLIPPLKLLNASQFLQLRGIADLADRNPAAAVSDYLASFQLSAPLKRPQFLVFYLIRCGMRAVDDAILWEGLRVHVWSGAQLAAMEAALSDYDSLAEGQNAFRAERAGSLREFYFQSQGADHVKQMMPYRADKDDDEFHLVSIYWLRPGGWDDQDKCWYVRQKQQVIDAIEPRSGVMKGSAFLSTERDSWAATMHASYVPFSTIAQEADLGVGSTIARAETYRRLARLACRLEEYYLAHDRHYPDALSDLPDMPPHLNQEVLSENPLQYHRKGDSYALYSVGWDQKDDGGVLSNVSGDERTGDWPWPGP